MRRLVLVPAGLLVGFTAAAAVVVSGLAVEMLAAPPDAGLGIVRVASLVVAMAAGGALGSAAGAVWRALLWVCLGPLCMVAGMAELAGLRSLRWLAVGTGVLTALVPTVLRAIGPDAAGPPSPLELRLTALLFLAGVAGGAAFWLVAGRRQAAVR